MAVSPAKAILDTSIYLPFLRRGDEIHDFEFLLRPTLLYMSSVVFAELYAGVKDRFTLRRLDYLTTEEPRPEGARKGVIQYD